MKKMKKHWGNFLLFIIFRLSKSRIQYNSVKPIFIILRLIFLS